jgi:hypothetical protein
LAASVRTKASTSAIAVNSKGKISSSSQYGNSITAIRLTSGSESESLDIKSPGADSAADMVVMISP